MKNIWNYLIFEPEKSSWFQELNGGIDLDSDVSLKMLTFVNYSFSSNIGEDWGSEGLKLFKIENSKQIKNFKNKKFICLLLMFIFLILSNLLTKPDYL